MSALLQQSLLEAAAQLRRKETTSVALTQACLERITAENPKLNAFLLVTEELALQQAAQADRDFAAGIDKGLLQGIPIALKDVFCTKGIPTTCASLLFQGHVPQVDAAVTERLAAAGSVMLGKLNMHELAYGVTSNNPHYGPVRNPSNPNCVPGGSSGGSAAAVASGMCFMAMGSDTGGSIRIPAAFCGIVGLKPSYGRVSRRGVMPLDFSLDHMGPLTRRVGDAAAVLQVLAGADPEDDTSADQPVPQYPTRKRGTLQGLRLGVPKGFYFEGLHQSVERAVRQVAERAKALGAEVVPLALPDIPSLNTVGRVILLSEASAVMERFWDRRHQIGADVCALLNQGRLLPATDYIHAQRVRRQMVAEFRKATASCDIFLTPTTPTVAAPIGQNEIVINGRPEDFRLATTRFVRGINVLGWPAISVPAGTDDSQMPIGAQLVGKPFGEGRLLEAALELER